MFLRMNFFILKKEKKSWKIFHDLTLISFILDFLRIFFFSFMLFSYKNTLQTNFCNEL